jgi:hypothetical protein
VHKASDNPARVDVLIVTPSTHNVLKQQKDFSQDEIEKIMQGNEIRAVRVDGKRFKFGFHEDVKLSALELLGDGAEEFSLSVKRYGGKPITLSSAAKGGGKMLFVQNSLFRQNCGWKPALDRREAAGVS